MIFLTPSLGDPPTRPLAIVLLRLVLLFFIVGDLSILVSTLPLFGTVCIENFDLTFKTSSDLDLVS